MQTTAQDYRDMFVDDHLPLTQISVHRSVAETFVKKAKEFRLDLTARNVFDYLMHNANADKRQNNQNFGHTAPIEKKDIADYTGKKAETIKQAIIKLVKADLIQRHPVKRNVYIIPSMIRAKAQLAEQAAMKRHVNITKVAEAKIAQWAINLERPLTESERKRAYAEANLEYGKRNSNGKHHHNGNGSTPELPFG